MLSYILNLSLRICKNFKSIFYDILKNLYVLIVANFFNKRDNKKDENTNSKNIMDINKTQKLEHYHNKINPRKIFYIKRSIENYKYKLKNSCSLKTIYE